MSNPSNNKLNLFIGLIFLSLFFSGGTSYSLEQSHIDKAIHEYLAEKIPDAINGLKFSIGSYPQTLMSCSGSPDISVEGTIPPDLPKRLPLKVSISDPRGKRISAYVTISLSRFRNVVCSSSYTRQGEILSVDNCIVAPADIFGHIGKPAVEMSQLSGRRAKKCFNAGEVIDLEDTEPIPAVVRGDRVRIIANAGNLRVSTEGIAKEDGFPGEFIRVKNTNSGKVITGKLTENKEVEVSSRP